MRSRPLYQLESTTFGRHFGLGKAIVGFVTAIVGATCIFPPVADLLKQLIEHFTEPRIADKLAELIAGALIGLGLTLFAEEFRSAAERRSDAERHNDLIRALRSSALPGIRAAFDLGVILVKSRDGVTAALRKQAMSHARQLNVEEVVKSSIDHLRGNDDALGAIKVAINLQNAPECGDALLAGYAIVSRAKAQPVNLPTVLDLTRKGLSALCLRSEVAEYIVQGLAKYNENTCTDEAWNSFAVLSVAYIDNVHTGVNPKVAMFFESERPPIDDATTIARVNALLRDFMARAAA